MVKIDIKPLKGDKFEVEINEELKVEDLKKQIASLKAEFPADQQKLIYQGKILVDASAIKEYQIKEGEFLVIMVAKAKPPAAPEAAAAAAPAATPAAEAPGSAPAPMSQDVASSNLVTGSNAEATITQLCDMGFPREEVERALRAAFNNPDRATEYLLSGIPEGAMDTGAPPAATPAAAAPAAAGGGGGAAAPFPAAGGGGGGQGMTPGAFPAIPAGGASRGPPLPPQLEALREHPQFNQVARMVRQQPHVLPQMLRALTESNPELMEAIQQNPDAFQQLLEEVAGGQGDVGGPTGPLDPVETMLMAAQQALGGGGGGGGGGGRQMQIQLSDEERAAVNRLKELGFDEQAALQAYLQCEKNEEYAANVLLSGVYNDDPMEQDQ